MSKCLNLSSVACVSAYVYIISLYSALASYATLAYVYARIVAV